jgi:FtsZ-binding cell division protein ZapB
MKTIYILLFCCLIDFELFAQVPQTINFEGQARTTTGVPIANQQIRVRIRIREGASLGTVLLTEVFTPTTNSNGVFNVAIGSAQPTQFATISWASAKNIQVSMDASGGTNFTVIGSYELRSMPFALQAQTAVNATNAVNATTALNATNATNAINAINSLNTLNAVNTTKIQNQNVATTTPTNGQVLTWDGTAWTATAPNRDAIALQGRSIANTNPTTGQVLTFNGTNWLPSNAASNATTLQNQPIATTSPTTGQVLKWDGTLWSPATDNNSGTAWALDANNTMSYSGGSLLLSGTTGNTPTSGSGTRLMWIPNKKALRAGQVDGNEWDNNFIGQWSFAFGLTTVASGDASTAFGYHTIATGGASTASGYYSQASGGASTAFGNNAIASGISATAFGHFATASGNQSTALGNASLASGEYSMTFGNSVSAYGKSSFCLGNRITTAVEGAFFLGDNSLIPISYNNTINSMYMRFAGGYRLYSNSELTAGVNLLPGAGSWSSISDRHKKENFQSINPESVLQKIARLPISEWNYKAQDRSNRHLGPMAQDFYEAFKLGGIGNDTTITTTDIDGVNMVAIQALYQRTEELKAKTLEINQLKAELESMRSENQELKNQQINFEHRMQALEAKAVPTVSTRQNKKNKSVENLQSRK